MEHDRDDALLNQLRELRDDVPPMPEGLHASWMRAVEEDMNTNHEEQTVRETPVRRPWLRWVSAAAALVFLVGGTILSRPALRPEKCAAGSVPEEAARSVAAPAAYSESDDYDYGAYEEAEADGAYESAAFAMGGSLAKSNAADAVQPETDRKIIRTVDMAITTREYAASCEELKALCAAHGGSVTHMSDTTGSRSLHTAYFTLRIPAERLDDFLAAVQGTGTVTRQEISASDVTESYRDTQARLDTQRAKMERLTQLLLEASDVSDLLAIENEIADTQYLIDSYQGSLNHTDSQAAFSTVDITLKEEKPEENLTAPELTFGERLQAAVSAGWESFVEFLEDMAVFLLAALPYLIVLALIVVIVRLVVRRRRKNK